MGGETPKWVQSQTTYARLTKEAGGPWEVRVLQAFTRCAHAAVRAVKACHWVLWVYVVVAVVVVVFVA